jgi:uncharacterized protein (DUF362 family)/Pyruvate/2-oxoacid:ferredoxin oxidoreductase delta subunit
LSKVALARCEDYNPERVREALTKLLDPLGGMGEFVKPGQKVLLKVNLLAAKPPERAITSHPEIIRAVAQAVRQAGGEPSIGDSPAGAVKGVKRYWKETGIGPLAEEMSIPVVNFETSGVVRKVVGKRSYYLAKPVLECDVLINLPKMKTHGLLMLTGAVKNMYGAIPGLRKAELHRDNPRPNDFASVVVDIYSKAKPKLTIMDGILGMDGNGPASGNLRWMKMLLASGDGIALDATFSRLVGIKPRDVFTTRIASERGLGQVDEIEVVGEKLEDLTVKGFKVPSAAALNLVPRFMVKALAPLVWVKPIILAPKCTKCGFCVESCPTSALSMGTKSVPIFNYKLCINCLCCHEVCPESAVEIETSWVGKRLVGTS